MPETLWEFETQHLLVKLEIEPSECPDTSWMDNGQLEEFENGSLIMFDATCTVYGPRNEILGQDVLGECSYYKPEEFVTQHRDSDPMNRNCTTMRTAQGNNVVICHYFPGMVRQACDEARTHAKLQSENYRNLLAPN